MFVGKWYWTGKGEKMVMCYDNKKIYSDDELKIETPENPKVNHPPHYTQGRKHEPISVIEDWELNFNLGNVLKYISRAGRKGDTLEDLQKAEYYLTREIERMKNECVSV